MNLTPSQSSRVKAPGIAECPVSLECRVVEIKPLGSHDLFLAEIVNVSVDERYLDDKGKFNLNSTRLVAYSHGEYFELGEKLGSFGYSVKKERKPVKKPSQKPMKKMSQAHKQFAGVSGGKKGKVVAKSAARRKK